MLKKAKKGKPGLPRLEKSKIVVTGFDDRSGELRYGLSLRPEERLAAIEINRRMVYGKDRTSFRLKRLLEVAELSQG